MAATDRMVVVTAVGGQVGHGRDEDLLAWRSADGGRTWQGPVTINRVRASAREARIQRFREETREQRMRIADEAEQRTGRKVAWGAVCGDDRRVFTSMAVPVMTRLRMSERQVLDTLVRAGVARSRADALAWCVRLVRDHEGEWIDQLRDALVAVNEARASGPTPSSS